MLCLVAPGAGLSGALVRALQQLHRDSHTPTVLLVRDGAEGDQLRLSPSFMDSLTGTEPVAISREEIMQAVMETPPALVRAADRQPSAAKMRGLMVVAALAADTSRTSRRAQEAIARRGLEHARMPVDRGSRNWLKAELIARRKGWC